MSTEDALRAEVDAARWRESQAEQRETATIDERDTLRAQLNNANEAFAQAIHQRDALRDERDRALKAFEDAGERLLARARELDTLRAEFEELRQDIRAVVEDPDRVLAVLDGAPASAPLPTEPLCLDCGVDNCEHVEATTVPARAEQLARDLQAAGILTDGEGVWARMIATRLIEFGWTKESR